MYVPMYVGRYDGGLWVLWFFFITKPLSQGNRMLRVRSLHSGICAEDAHGEGKFYLRYPPRSTVAPTKASWLPSIWLCGDGQCTETDHFH